MLGIRQFFKLNISKLIFGSLISGLIFGGLATLIFAIAFFFYTEIELNFALEIIIAVTLFMFFLIGIVSPLGVVYRTYYFKKVFTTPPFNQLKEIGFREKTIYENNRWHFTENILTKTIDGYEIIVDIDPKNFGIIKFFIKCHFKKRSNEELIRIEYIIKRINIHYDYHGMSKEYNVRKMPALSILKLDQELNEFVNILKSLDIQPF